MARHRFSDRAKLVAVDALFEPNVPVRELLRHLDLQRSQAFEMVLEAHEHGRIGPERLKHIKEELERPASSPFDETVKALPLEATDQRLEAVLPSVMNMEPKAILTLLLRDSPQSAEALSEQFQEATGGIWAPRLLPQQLSTYIIKSLDPMGLVMYNLNPSDSSICYACSAAGLRYGQPLAAFALEIAYRYGFSLYQILGPTNSPGKSRPPLNRFKILKELNRVGEQRIVDLEEAVQLGAPGVRYHLKAFRKMGFVEYDSADAEQRGWAVYEWVEGKSITDVRPMYRYPTFTRLISTYLAEKGVGDCKEIAEHLLGGSLHNRNPISMLGDISRVLTYLRSEGFVSSRYIGGQVQSHVWLTALGREFASEFTNKVSDAVLGGNELAAMREIHHRYLEDHPLFAAHATSGLRSYLAISPLANKKTPEEWTAAIYDYIECRGTMETRPKDVERDLKAPLRYLPVMVDQGLLTREKHGKRVVYRTNTGIKQA